MPPSAEIALLYYVLTSTKLVLFSCVMKQNDGAKSLLADCFADLIKKQNLETSHHQHGNQGSHYFTHVIVDAETRRTIRQYLRSFPELLLLEENDMVRTPHCSSEGSADTPLKGSEPPPHTQQAVSAPCSPARLQGALPLCFGPPA